MGPRKPFWLEWSACHGKCIMSTLYRHEGISRDCHHKTESPPQNRIEFDSTVFFDVVLQCQRHLQGPLHPDVAATLHNVGIVQLRSQNHSEALKAFEEAARIRKGSLGKDHPLVAVR